MSIKPTASVKLIKDSFIFHSINLRIIEKNGGKEPLTYHQFQNVVAAMDSPSLPESTVGPECTARAYTPLTEDHDDVYGVPTLEELGAWVDDAF